MPACPEQGRREQGRREVKPLSAAEASMCLASLQKRLCAQDEMIRRAVPILGEHAQGINTTTMRRAARDLLADMSPR